MKKLLLSTLLLTTSSLLASQASATDFTANDLFRADVEQLGVHEANSEEDEGIIYALYEDFDNNGFKDLYYIKSQKNNTNDFYSGDYHEYLYMNNHLVHTTKYNGPGQGISATNSLQIAYANNRFYWATPIAYRAWDNDGIAIKSFDGQTLSPVQTFEHYREGHVFNKANGYYYNHAPVSKTTYDEQFKPFSQIRWTQIINDDNISSLNSPMITRNVLAKMEAEELLFLDGRRFRDVPADAEYYEAVENLIALGAVSSNAYLYNPSKNLTRGQAAKMIVLALGLEVPKSSKIKLTFTDVPAKHEFQPYIAVLKEQGIMNGYDEATFGMNQPLKRSHMAQILVKALKLPKTQQQYRFTDIQNAKTEQYVNSLAAYNIVNTASTTFKPQAYVTRAQMALFLNRSLQLID